MVIEGRDGSTGDGDFEASPPEFDPKETQLRAMRNGKRTVKWSAGLLLKGGIGLGVMGGLVALGLKFGPDLLRKPTTEVANIPAGLPTATGLPEGSVAQVTEEIEAEAVTPSPTLSSTPSPRPTEEEEPPEEHRQEEAAKPTKTPTPSPTATKEASGGDGDGDGEPPEPEPTETTLPPPTVIPTETPPPSSTPTASATIPPTSTPTKRPTETATSAPTTEPTKTPTPSPTPTRKPSPTTTKTATKAPTPSPTATEKPTEAPTPTPEREATVNEVLNQIEALEGVSEWRKAQLAGALLLHMMPANQNAYDYGGIEVGGQFYKWTVDNLRKVKEILSQETPGIYGDVKHQVGASWSGIDDLGKPFKRSQEPLQIVVKGGQLHMGQPGDPPMFVETDGEWSSADTYGGVVVWWGGTEPSDPGSGLEPFEIVTRDFYRLVESLQSQGLLDDSYWKKLGIEKQLWRPETAQERHWQAVAQAAVSGGQPFSQEELKRPQAPLASKKAMLRGRQETPIQKQRRRDLWRGNV